MRKQFLVSALLLSSLAMVSCANGYGQQGNRGYNNRAISTTSTSTATKNVTIYLPQNRNKSLT